MRNKYSSTKEPADTVGLDRYAYLQAARWLDYRMALEHFPNEVDAFERKANAMRGEPTGDPCDCGTAFGAGGFYAVHAVGNHPDCTGEESC